MATNKNYQRTAKSNNAVNRDVAKKSDAKIKETSLLSETYAASFYKIQPWVIFLLGFCLYFNTLFFDYTLDDRLMIFENKFTTAGFKSIDKILSKDAFVGYFGEEKNLLTGGRYRPLTHVMFAVEWAIFKNNPFVGHLLNVLFYGLLGVVLLKVLRRILPDDRGSTWYMSLPFIVTALFMAHPLHTEVVANVKGRDEIITTLLLLLSLWFAIAYADNKKPLNLIMLGVTYFFSLFSKENAITFVFVIPMTLYFFRGEKFKKLLPVALPMLLALVVYFALRFKFGLMKFGTKEMELLNNPYLEATGGERIATVFYTLWKYIQLMIFPHPLTHDYYPKQIPIMGWGDPRAFMSFLIYVGIGIASIWGFMKRNIIGFALLFYLATLSISSNLLFNIGAFMNERFVFLPMLGFVILLSVFLLQQSSKYFKDKQSHLSFVKISLLILMIGYSLKTFTRNFAWKDDFTLFTTDVHTSTNSAKVNVSAGGMLVERGQKEKDPVKKQQMLDEAKIYLRKGLEIHPKYIAGWILYGNAFLYSEQWADASYCYKSALKLAPGYDAAFINLHYVAQTTGAKKLYDISLDAYRELLRQNPKKENHRCEMACILDDAGMVDTAMIMLNNLVKDNPKYAEAWNRLGQIYGKKLNNIDKSIELLLKANSLDQKNASVWENLGVAFGIKREYAKSANAFENAIKYNPKSAQIYFNLALTYDNMGQKDKAAKMRTKGQEVAQAAKASEAK